MKKLIFTVLIWLPMLLPSYAAEAEKAKVVTSFSLLEDIVAQIAGEQVEHYSIVKRGSDSHVYRPTPADLKALGDADLLLTVGAGFEGWLSRSVAKGFHGEQLSLAKVVGLPQADEQPDEQQHDEHDQHSHQHAHSHSHSDSHGHQDAEGHSEHLGIDPHLWLDVANIIQLIPPLTQHLSELAPQHQALFEQRAAAYLEQLTELDSWVRQQLQSLPESRRKAITTHMAYGHFGEAYGLSFMAPQGISTEEEPSARDIAQIIRQIRKYDIAAVFIEHNSDPRIIEQIARETQAHIGGKLYPGSLTQLGGEADSYIKLMQHNTNTLVNALGR